MNLALFDFDGTITHQDVYTEFLFYATSKRRIIWGGLLTSPVIALYKLGLLPARYTRPVLSKMAFGGRKTTEVDALAVRFVRDYLPSVIRPQALEKICWHQQQGDEIYVVSASLSPYLAIWCQQHGLKLLCSTLEEKQGRYTGRYLYGDCSLNNKVAAIKQTLDLATYSRIYAYGDTYEDLPMLNLADEKYFQWRKIASTDGLSHARKTHEQSIE
ncbi:HAD family hydrolase [Vibrio scophthalmi]|uniref:Phosphoserine phosphatase n=1 Tax=Vibrio scophthalmi LMG 19158 TaxID=870967 RepID=F9RS62_9VIBR|nr:HAD family hydrolase [Vibrio scophthalmi]EGU32566.1 phosphoserine phosphatase [Vibrio scophthalmi LMG 19158]